MKASTAFKILIILALVGLLAFLAYSWLGLGPYVRGSISYDLPKDLPLGSTLTIELRDTSYQDASSITIARQVIADPGSPPHNFKIGYGSLNIESRATYSIGVRIEGPADELFFINDISYEVITRGNPKKADIELVPVLPLP